MTPLLYILIGAVLILFLFLTAPLIEPRYTVIRRVGAVQLASHLNTIRISAVIIKRSGKQGYHEKGLFVLGATRGGVHANHYDAADHYEAVFPLTEQEIDEMITLLKSQPVFSVSWKKKYPVKLSIDRSSQKAKLIFKRFAWMDCSFVAGIDDEDVERLLGIFESLKGEAAIAQISA